MTESDDEWIIPTRIDGEVIKMYPEFKQMMKYATEAKIAVGYFYENVMELIRHDFDGIERVELIIGQQTNVPTRTKLDIGHQGRDLLEGGYSKEDAMRELATKIDRIKSEDDMMKLDKLVDLVMRGILVIKIYEMDKGYYHRKGYWFNCKSTLHTDIMICGSHNMTLPAFTYNKELSYVHREQYYSDDFLQIFQQDWEDAKDFNKDLLIIASFSNKYRSYKSKKRREARRDHDVEYEGVYLPPVECFKAMIKMMGKDYLLEREDVLLAFQKIDYNLCRETIQKFGGVILATTVGLGKSYIAARLVQDYHDRGERYLFIVPPNTMDQWIEYMSIFNIPVEEGKNLISMNAVSQKTFPNNMYNDFDVIVVDESHNWRNRDSNRWNNFMDRIHNANADYVLLSATPINNSLKDLHAQVAMFKNERFKNEGLNDLFAALGEFDDKSDEDQTELVNKIKELRKKVIVRTTRHDLKELYDEIIIPDLGKVNIIDPQIHQEIYKLRGNAYRELFDMFVPHFIDPLVLPHVYILNPSAGSHIHGLFKILLYKRMESSVYALYRSVSSLEDKNKRLLSMLAEYTIDEIRDLERVQYDRLLRTGHDVDEKSVLEAIQNIQDDETTSSHKMNYVNAIQHDLRIISKFKKILNRLILGDMKFRDDKLEALKQLISNHHDKKILVFTQFTDTAKYIYHNIKDCHLVSGKMKLVSGSTKNKVIAAAQFSPSSYANMKDAIEHKYGVKIGPPYTQLMITTDAFSEGVNLTEADVVINYDLPWNPIRIVQRIGRANRIGRTRDVDVFNFLPDANIDKEMQLIKTLKRKIGNIIEIIGSEHSILSPDEMRLIRQKKMDDLELFKKKRQMIRNANIDEIERVEHRAKISNIDEFLISMIEQNAIHMQDINSTEVPESKFYTVLPYNDHGRVFIYEMKVGNMSYYRHESFIPEDRKVEHIPIPRVFISPRTGINKTDVSKANEFEDHLADIRKERKKVQLVADDRKTNAVKMRIASTIAKKSNSLIMTMKNKEISIQMKDLAARLDKLNPPSSHKTLMTKFESKWLNNGDYMSDLPSFISELYHLVNRLEITSGSVAHPSSIDTILRSFIIYDREWKAARKKEK